MKPGLLLTSLAALLLALPLLARADTRPDFNDDAKPILRTQPGLLQYVKANFDVKETGYAKVPGDDDHSPPPPYIFRARHRGEEGPYHITLLLLIQPGPPGHVLLVKEDAPGTTPAPSQPSEAPAQPQQPPPPSEQPVAQGPAGAPSSAPSGPTSATPSGPIPSGSFSSQPPSTNPPSLEPPPDPAPPQ